MPEFAMNTTARRISAELEKMGDTQRAEVNQRFFKTGPGEYGEGDVFIGITVPDLRKLAKKHQAIPLKDNKQLLESRIHEERLFALLVLVLRYQEGDENDKARIYKLYIGATRYINNWDLVDVTAPSIVGHFLSDKSRKPLYDLAKSPSL
jgi:3-methyladenine DNA glycosylase AlkD